MLEAAQKAYDELAHAKTCGRLAKLDVLLHKQLYPVVHVEQATRVFAASINFGKVGWKDAFRRVRRFGRLRITSVGLHRSTSRDENLSHSRDCDAHA